MISEVLTQAAAVIRKEGWTTGNERDDRGWCLVGAVGYARFNLMTRQEHRDFIKNHGLAHHDQARKTPFLELLHDDEELRRVVAVLYAAYHHHRVPGTDVSNYAAISQAAAVLAGFNDSLTGPERVLDLLARAAALAAAMEARERDPQPYRVRITLLRSRAAMRVERNNDWPTDADLAAFYAKELVGS